MKRDDEIKRLVKYAQALGAKVVFKPYKPYSNESATWEAYNDSSATITVYMRSNQSKLETILSLIHELGHHKDFIYGRRRLNRFSENDQGLSKNERKKVLKSELAGTRYWLEIYQDTHCQFPLYRLFLAMEMDMVLYQIWCETDRALTYKKRRLLWKSLKAKHKRGYEND